MAGVVAKGLGKEYGNGSFALKDVDLKIDAGELVVLVGPSGCGKSTLLRSIAGLETPTEGTLEIGGRDVTHLAPAERGVGMVFQDYALYPHMSVRENLAFGLKMRKMAAPEIRRRVGDVSEMLGLGSLLERKPAQLSGGQRQRVAIGRALVKEPAVLLLDEPLSNLDAQLRARTRMEIAALHRRIRSTTLYVTHDQEEAMTLADRIVVLDRGRIQQVGPPMEVYQNPSNRFVASFIGSPRMSFLEGELRTAAGKWIFEAAGQRLDVSLGQHPLRPGRYALGFRPESAKIAVASAARGLSARLTWVELHGHEIQVNAELGDAQVILRTSSRSEIAAFEQLGPGDTFKLEPDPSALHWFESGQLGRRVETTIARSAA